MKICTFDDGVWRVDLEKPGVHCGKGFFVPEKSGKFVSILADLFEIGGF